MKPLLLSESIGCVIKLQVKPSSIVNLGRTYVGSKITLVNGGIRVYFSWYGAKFLI
jgi:hypothetical protein